MAAAYGVSTSEVVNWRDLDITAMQGGTEYRGFAGPGAIDDFALQSAAQMLALEAEGTITAAERFRDSEAIWCNQTSGPQRSPNVSALFQIRPLISAFLLRNIRVMTIEADMNLPVRATRDPAIKLDFLAAGILHDRQAQVDVGAAGVRFALALDCFRQVKKRQSAHPIIAERLNQLYPHLVTFGR